MYKVLRVWGVRIGFRVEGAGFYWCIRLRGLGSRG